MIELRRYVDEHGREVVTRWIDSLDAAALAHVSTALSRLANGNTSHVKSVGEGVQELKINFGPGYRVYFAWQGRAIVIVLGGGTKKRQDRDISEAKRRWAKVKRKP